MNHSVLRAMDILELLAQSREAPSLSQIAKALDIPKSSAFDILAALAQKGFVRVDDPKNKTYALGLSTYRMGMAYMGSMDLYTAAHGELAALRQALGYTVYLAVPENDHVVYVDKLETDSPIRFTMRTGTKNAMYCTGLGKAILATYPLEAVEQLLQFPLEKRTATTITTRQALLAELETTRQRGYALDLGEDNALLRCVSVPIRDAQGCCIAAISVSMLAASYEKEDPQALAASLTATALEISHRLGYQETVLY